MTYFSDMQSLDELYRKFEKYRKKHVFKGGVSELYTPANYLMELGGKRMRPLLTMLAFELYDKKVDHVLAAALAIEVFHNFSLMHDDIMDASPLRRGQPTTHFKFDINAAILSGDWMLIHSYQLLNQYDAPLNKNLISLLNKTATEVCEGQQLDINFETNHEVSKSEYLKMIKCKTAVLLGAALKMGGMLGGAHKVDLSQLYLAGVNMGLSFQLMDDYLDAFGEDSGKVIGGDIIRNKKTLLYIHCLSQLNATGKKDLQKIFQSKGKTKVKLILQFYGDTQSDQFVHSLALNYGKKALKNLSKLGVEGAKRKDLEDLFSKLLTRKN